MQEAFAEVDQMRAARMKSEFWQRAPDHLKELETWPDFSLRWHRCRMDDNTLRLTETRSRCINSARSRTLQSQIETAHARQAARRRRKRRLSSPGGLGRQGRIWTSQCTVGRRTNRRGRKRSNGTPPWARTRTCCKHRVPRKD